MWKFLRELSGRKKYEAWAESQRSLWAEREQKTHNPQLEAESIHEENEKRDTASGGWLLVPLLFLCVYLYGHIGWWVFVVLILTLEHRIRAYRETVDSDDIVILTIPMANGRRRRTSQRRFLHPAISRAAAR